MIDHLSAPGELEQWSEGCIEALQKGDFTRIRVRNHRHLILAEYGADDILIDLSKKGAGRVYLHIESTSKEVLRWFKSCVTDAMMNVRPNLNPNAERSQSSYAQHPQNGSPRSSAQPSGQSAFDQAYSKAQAARRQASQEEQTAKAPDLDATRIAPGVYREDPLDLDATRIAQSPFERARDRQTLTQQAAQDVEIAADAAYDTDPYADEVFYDDSPYDDYEDQTADFAPVDYGDETPESATQYLDYPEEDPYTADDDYADDFDDGYAADDGGVYDDGYADDAGYDPDGAVYDDPYGDPVYENEADGYDEGSEHEAPQTLREKWEALTEKTWFLILMLAVFPPLGLYLIWHYMRWTGGRRVLATAIGVAYFLFVWLGFLGVNTGINRDTFTNLRIQTIQSTGSNVQDTPDTGSDSTDASDSADTAASDTTNSSDTTANDNNTVLEQAVTQFNNWVSNLVP